MPAATCRSISVLCEVAGKPGPLALPAMPPAGSTLAIGNTAGAAAGNYTLSITGNSSGPGFPATSHSTDVDLQVAVGIPGAGTLVSPGNNATNVATQPTLSWNAVAGADDYRLELATDAGFGNVVLDTVVAGTSHQVSPSLSTSTSYFWRVTAKNACGTGSASTVYTFRTLAAPGDCGVDQVAVNLLGENFSGGLGAFTTTGSSGAQTWAIAGSPPAGSASGGNAALAVNIGSVSDQRLISPPVALPADQLPLSLQFWNHQEMEDRTGGCFDGGLLEVSNDGGTTWTQIDGAAILNRAYDGPISDSHSNPLATMNAWCGDPRAWENYINDLNAYAGQTVQFRWRLGTDSSVSRPGWHLDDIKVQACETG